MSARGHIIDIDSIVLNGVDPRDRGRIGALIEAEMRQRLSAPDVGASAGDTPGEEVAGEVARAVMRALPGGNSRE